MVKKQLRYYVWLILDFFKKNSRATVISFLASLLLTIAAVIIAPYFGFIVSTNKQVVGYSQIYPTEELPEEVLQKISSSLFTIKPNGELVPLLAEKYELIDNGTTYRITLKKNLFWSDNTPFTARDIQLNFKDIKTSIPNPYAIDFHFENTNKALTIFPVYLTQPLIKPPLTGIGGDYRVAKRKVNKLGVSELLLIPLNSKLPYLVYKFYENEQKMISAYKLGDITQFTTPRAQLIESINGWNNTTIIKGTDYTRLITAFFALKEISRDKNLTKEDTDELRRALIQAIPQDQFSEFGEIAKSPIPPTSWAFDTSSRGHVADVTKAKKTLQKYTFATAPARLKLYTYYSYIQEANIIAESLKNVGVEVNIEYIGFETPQDFDILLAALQIPKDPDQYFFWHSTQAEVGRGNIAGYNNPRIDILLEEARDTLDVAKRKQLYLKFQDVLMNNPPAYFLYFPHVYLVQRK